MTMRSKRCVSCRETFLSADLSVTECQNCTGDLPDNALLQEQLKRTAERQEQARKTKAQQVDIKQLVDNSTGSQQVDLKKLSGTTPVKRGRKPKDTTSD